MSNLTDKTEAMDLAKTLEGLSAAATQGACEVLAPDTEHDFGVPIVATDYPGTYGPTNGLVLWATMLPTEIDTKDTARAEANAAFTAALWNAYRTGKLVVVDVDAIRAQPYPECDDYIEVRRDERERIITVLATGDKP